MNRYIKKEDEYNKNLTKAYAELWKRCSALTQDEIEARDNFVLDIYNNPIKLIQTIREHSLSYEEASYDMKIIT